MVIKIRMWKWERNQVLCCVEVMVSWANFQDLSNPTIRDLECKGWKKTKPHEPYRMLKHNLSGSS